MLTLNVKSSNYMCIDIDPQSIIHDLLRKKLHYLRECIENDEETEILNRNWKLKWLENFHISLGKPPVTKEQMGEYKTYVNKDMCHMDLVPIIGDIMLAPVYISEKDGKKSAWIPLHPHWIAEAFEPLWSDINLDDFDSFDHRCDEYPVKLLHVSIANLTRNPHDSIARPEDCIVNTLREW